MHAGGASGIVGTYVRCSRRQAGIYDAPHRSGIAGPPAGRSTVDMRATSTVAIEYIHASHALDGRTSCMHAQGALSCNLRAHSHIRHGYISLLWALQLPTQPIDTMIYN